MKRTSYIPPRIQINENKEVDSSKKSLKRNSAEMTPPSLNYTNNKLNPCKGYRLLLIIVLEKKPGISNDKLSCFQKEFETIYVIVLFLLHIDQSSSLLQVGQSG